MPISRLAVIACWMLGAPVCAGALSSHERPREQSVPEQFEIAPPALGGKSIKSMTELDDVIKENTLREMAELDKLGYLQIPNEQAGLYLYENHEAYFGDSAKIRKRTPFTISEISARQLKRRGIIGMDFDNNQLYDRVLQVFSSQKEEAVTVILEEIHYVQAGMSITEIKEMYNADINGTPGIATRRRAQNGIEVYLVTWSTDSRLYNLSVAGHSGNTSTLNMEAALALAKSVR